MARHSKDSPFYEKNIRILAGSAIFVEVALTAGGLWRDTDLDDFINDKNGYEKDNYSGLYRKMLQGTITENHVCRRVQKTLNGGELKFWRDLPYWGLLRSNGTYGTHIDKTLKSIQSRVRHHIWSIPFDKGEHKYSSRAYTSLDSIKAISKYKNLDALLTLTAWARESREQNILVPSYQCAQYTRKIFAYTVCHTPHLFIRWPLLVEQYKNQIWSYLDTDMSENWLEINLNNLIDEIHTEEKKARKEGIKLPPLQLVRRINREYLIYTH